MQATITPIEKSRVKILIEVEKEKVDNFRKKAVQIIAERVTVPGFRKGKASEEALIMQVGEKQIIDETVDIVIQNTYVDVVKENNIQVVAAVEKIEFISYDPFKYEVIVAVYPEVKLKNYKKIKIKKEKVTITDKEAKDVITNLQKRLAEFKEVKRVAKEGDKITIDFEGKDEKGVVLDRTKSKNHPVIIGDGHFVPDFENKLVGLKTGDEKEINVTFPADYHEKNLQNKKVIFTIKVHKVEETKLPEVDKEFIKKVGGKEMEYDEFLSNTKEQLKKVREDETEKKREEELFEKLLKESEVEVPDALVNEELEYMVEDQKKRVESQGVPFEKFLEQSGKTIEKLKEEWKKNAEDRVGLRFILRAIVDKEKEKTEVSEEEVKQEIEKITAMYPEETREKVKEMYEKGIQHKEELKNRLQIKKVVEMLLE